MKSSIIALLFTAACSGSSEYTYETDPVTGEVQEVELGQVDQGLSVKPSNEFTYGVSSSPSMQKCTVSLGAGSSYSCMVPSRTTVRYKLIGQDDFNDQTEGEMSWRAMVRRAYNISMGAGPGGLDQGKPFTFIEDNSSAAWVVFTRGNCPGDPTGNNMNAFVCVNYNGYEALTESLAGTYKKTTGLVTVTFDIAAMDQRIPHALSPQTARYNEHWHQLLEHVGHLGAMLPLGNGTTDTDDVTGFVWSSRTVQRPGLLPSDFNNYDYANYTHKEKCILGSFSSLSSTTFTLQSGTCTN